MSINLGAQHKNEMNKLVVPETTFIEKFKIMFLPAQKRAMFSYWRVTSIFMGGIVAIGIFLFVSVGEGAIHDYLILYALLAGAGYYVLDSQIVRIFRKRIIADMKSAKQFLGVYGFRGYSSHVSGENVSIVPTMAGNLKFVTDGESPFAILIRKKSGELFDYYEFPEAEGFNKKDLRVFIAVKSGLD